MPKNQQLQPQIPSTPMRYMWFLTKESRGVFLSTVLIVTLAQVIGTSLPLLFKQVIDSAQGVAEATATQGDVWFWALSYPVAIGVMFVFWRVSGFVGMRWMTSANARSYEILFEYLGKHSHTYFSNRFAGSLSSKITHASEGAQSLYEQFVWSYYPGILALLLTMGYIFNVSIVAGAIFVGLLLVLIPLNIFLAKYRRPHIVKYSAQTTKARGRLVDTITNISAVRQYALHDFELQRFSDEVSTMRTLNLKQWSISEWGLLANNFVIVVFEFALLIVTITLWTEGNLSTGTLIMLITLLMNISHLQLDV